MAMALNQKGYRNEDVLRINSKLSSGRLLCFTLGSGVALFP
jgi:hypothetical protein